MAYQSKIWRNRQTEFPVRRKLIEISTDVYDIERHEGLIFDDGDPFNANNMNGLESRIAEYSKANDQSLSENVTVINDRITSTETALTNSIAGNVSALNSKIDASVANLSNEIKIQKIVETTIPNSGWAGFVSNGITCFRRWLGNISPSALAVFTIPVGIEAQLTSSIIPLNEGGALYITSFQIPNVAIPLTVYLRETR